jgi:hypothetical protein
MDCPIPSLQITGRRGTELLFCFGQCLWVEWWLCFNNYLYFFFLFQNEVVARYIFFLCQVDCMILLVLLTPSYIFLPLQYGLELVLMKNFHEFVHEYLQKPEFTELMRRLGALGDGRQEQSNFTPNCWFALDYCWFAPTLTPNIMQAHCHRMSGRFPICILRLSYGRYCTV